MISKKFRLNRAQIQNIYKKGKGQNFGFLGVKRVSNNQSFSRFAVVVPKAIIKLASDRNRLRRVMFEELAQNEIAGKDFIVRLFKAPRDEKILRAKVKEILKTNV